MSAGALGPEVELLAGRPDEALRLAERIPRNAGRAEPSTWNRHQVDVARAHVGVGDPERATEIMTALRKKHPGWLKFQQPARDATAKSSRHCPGRSQRTSVVWPSSSNVKADRR